MRDLDKNRRLADTKRILTSNNVCKSNQAFKSETLPKNSRFFGKNGSSHEFHKTKTPFQFIGDITAET